MLRSVFNQIAARMDAATATRPSMMVTQAILAKTRKGLVEHGEDVAQFHAEGFSTLLAWISKGIKRSPEDTATLESATWQELVWVRRRLKQDQASLQLLKESPSSTAREVASQLGFALAIINNLVWLRMIAMKGPPECRELATSLADEHGHFWFQMACAAAGTYSPPELVELLRRRAALEAARQ
jgi:hypothetical protein